MAKDYTNIGLVLWKMGKLQEALDSHNKALKIGEGRIYFNNHYGGKAVVNAMQFKEMIGVSLSADEKRVMENAKGHILGN